MSVDALVWLDLAAGVDGPLGRSNLNYSAVADEAHLRAGLPAPAEQSDISPGPHQKRGLHSFPYSPHCFWCAADC